MNISRIGGIAAVLLIAGAPLALADGPMKLDAAGIQQVIVGHTVAGHDDQGNSFKEFYAPDNRIDGLWKGRTAYYGKWHLSGDQFCAEYKDDPSSNGCWTAAIDKASNKVYWYKASGAQDGDAEDLQSGNTTGL